jgi:glutamine amidotransferase
MRRTRVTVIDYGIGNILSVCRAFEQCGAEVLLTTSPSDVDKADRLVLPGVGAFSNGMAGLSAGGFVEPIRKYSMTSRPFLGICLGMQMMLEASEEFGLHEGLGLIPGNVVAIPPVGTDGKPHKIPHIGWNTLLPPTSTTNWNGTILAGIAAGTEVYFVHSFTAVPASPVHRLADCDYDGRVISAAVKCDNLYGCQFHPEKSGEAGLRIIKNFLETSRKGQGNE